MSKTIAIAGATGFVGGALAERLAGECRVVGLSRTARAASGPVREWRPCDLFSLLDAERALEGVDTAYYLVHAMMPSARLTQGSFEDMDLVAADNFARAAASRGVKQIIYLGGLMPPETRLSRHLASRLEVERTLAAYGVPLTALRAGLVLGRAGSSFVVVERLVGRLPWMICPAWTATPMQPVALSDAVELLAFCRDRQETFGGVFDIGTPETTTYRGLILDVARAMGLRRRLFNVPFFSPTLSRLWVRLVTGAPKALIYPLIESLKHPMVARDRRLQAMAGVPGKPLGQSIVDSIGDTATPLAFRRGRKAVSDRVVRSVQRLPLPSGMTADAAAREYLRWLPRLLPPIRVTVTGGSCVFRLWPFRVPLLILEHSAERSSGDRALLYVRGGFLSKVQDRARLEFRQPRGAKFLLVALHDFRPSLPWLLYSLTQARIHLLVMRLFGRYLGTMVL